MSDTCQCGHVKDRHGEHWDGCKYCECEAFTPAPAPPADDGKPWLDAPDGDGWWWRMSTDGEMSIGRYTNVSRGAWSPGQRFQRIPVPAPPPPPLPASRMVTLTAKVIASGSADGLRYYISWQERSERFHGGPLQTSKEAAAQWCRDIYGIEPTVEGEPA